MARTNQSPTGLQPMAARTEKQSSRTVKLTARTVQLTTRTVRQVLLTELLMEWSVQLNVWVDQLGVQPNTAWKMQLMAARSAQLSAGIEQLTTWAS